jgi:uncharacterized protein (TIGR03435 family)
MREKFGIGSRLLLSTAALVAISIPIASGHTNAPQSQSAQTAAKLSFEVASIKEWVDGKGPAGMVTVGIERSGDRIISRCASLKALLSYAYHLTRSVPVTGVPEWGKAGCGGTYQNTFAIEATVPAGTTDEQARQMMQTLLADRFKLVAHWETKDMPIFALVIGKTGFKLNPSDPAKDAPIPPHSIGCPPEDPACHNVVAGSGPISVLASSLSISAGRPVIDQTGLAGNYNLNLQWAGDTTADSPLPSLPAALREKFGLELKPQVGPVSTLVIDHVEKPSPN